MKQTGFKAFLDTSIRLSDTVMVIHTPGMQINAHVRQMKGKLWIKATNGHARIIVSK